MISLMGLHLKHYIIRHCQLNIKKFILGILIFRVCVCGKLCANAENYAVVCVCVGERLAFFFVFP